MPPGGRSAFGCKDEVLRIPPPAAAQCAGLPLLESIEWPERPAVTAAEQRPLEVPGSIDAQYTRWRDELGGRAVIARILARAKTMRAAGARRIGVKLLCERERWENQARINNKFTSRIARELLHLDPELAALIQLRELDSSEGISE